MTFNKPPEWGSRFHFPENVESNSDDLIMRVTEKLCVQMVDNLKLRLQKKLPLLQGLPVLLTVPY